MKTLLRYVLALALLAALLLPAAARAQAPDPNSGPAAAGPKSPSDDRATGFEQVKPGEGESVPGGTLLVIAYAVVWNLLFLYVVFIYRRQRKLEAEVEE